MFTYRYDHASSPAPGIYFIQTPLHRKQTLRLWILMSDHWPEGNIGSVIGFADRGLARGCTGAWLRWKIPTSFNQRNIDIALIRTSAQRQLWLNLNRCAVRTSWNNGDLIKHTHRERRLRVLPIFCRRSVICLTRRAWHMQLWPVDQSGYVGLHLARQCCLVAHPWGAASLHIFYIYSLLHFLNSYWNLSVQIFCKNCQNEFCQDSRQYIGDLLMWKERLTKKTRSCLAKTNVLHCSGRCESTLPQLV